MVVIGLTGGIGSGKSTVSGMLKELGAAVIDADKVGHLVLKRPAEAWQEIVATFGEDVLGPDGEINRGKLGARVFKHPGAVEKLNRIMHPRIYRAVQEMIEEEGQKDAEVVVVEAPVIIEAGWPPIVHEIWITIAPPATVLERLKGRGGLSEEQIRDRIGSQMPPEEKKSYADVVIDTSGSLPEVRVEVEKAWRALMRRKDKVARSPRRSTTSGARR